MYASIQVFACLLVTEPKVDPELVPTTEEDTTEGNDKILMDQVHDDGESYVTPREAFKRRELYLLWLTR